MGASCPAPAARLMDDPADLMIDVGKRSDECAIPGQDLISAARFRTGCVDPCCERSRCQLVQAVKGVVHRDPPHAGESGFGRQFAQLRLVQPQRAETLTVGRQR